MCCLSLPTDGWSGRHSVAFVKLPDDEVGLEQERTAEDADIGIHKRGPRIESGAQELGIDRLQQKHHTGYGRGNAFESQILPDTHKPMVARPKRLSQEISGALHHLGNGR